MNKLIEIPPASPFVNCKLGREPYAKVLTDIVRTNADGFVLAIDNKWGAGKTTFVSMWSQMLQNEGFQTLYFNAWENDFENNPFVAITAELRELLKHEDSDTFKEVIKKASVISKNVLPSIMKAFLKRYTGEDVAELFEKYSEGVLEAFQEDIDAYTERKKNIKEFHQDLEDYISQNSNGQPIVFIIDELDRCRPDYAVTVLENVKHLFSVKGIVFVLAIDKEQLGHAICGAYGSDNIDSNEYLRRFIDVEYSLPAPNLEAYLDYLMLKYKLKDFFNLEFRTKHELMVVDTKKFIDYTKFLFEIKKPTLRQQEKMLIHTGIVLRSFSSNSFIIPELLIFLIYIRLFHNEFYSKIIFRELNHQELLHECNIVLNVNLPKEKLNNYRISIEAMLVCFYNHYLEHDRQVNLNTHDDSDELPIFSNFDKSDNQALFKYLLRQESNNFDRSSTPIDYLLNKIELLEPLKDYE
jgi:hypothetical protein